jgi:hypothetical protein
MVECDNEEEQSMAEGKPGKRLVGKLHYICIVGPRAVELSTAIAVGVGGGICLLAGLIGIIGGVLHIFAPSTRADFIAFGVLLSLIGLRWVAGAKDSYKKAISHEPVAPITRHNIGLLSEADTLVRGSFLPLTDQQTELLRPASQGGHETPAAELLRATTHEREE